MTADAILRSQEHRRTCWHCRRVLTPADLDDPVGSLGRRGWLCGDCTDAAVLGDTCPTCGQEPTAAPCDDR